MTYRTLLPAVGVLMALSPAWLRAQDRPAANEVRQDEKGTFLGALFCSPRAEPVATADAGITARAATGAARPTGVLVTYVLPDSPAARADLRRNDLVLEYDGRKVRDSDHLATLIRADRPDRKVRLLVQRARRDLTVEATLALGPPLRLARAEAPDPVRGTAKANGPASVSVWATPLDSGKLKVAIEYYAGGRLKTVTCEGAEAEVDQAVRKLPERERNLVRVALQRLRTLHGEKAPAPRR
jgi:hypothetical protein